MAASGNAGDDERSDDEGGMEESMVRTRSSIDGWPEINGEDNNDGAKNKGHVNGHGSLDNNKKHK